MARLASPTQLSYNGRGQLVGVHSYQDLLAPVSNMEGDFNVIRTYDSQGRLLTAKEQRYTTGAWHALSDSTTRYDAAGNLTQSVSSHCIVAKPAPVASRSGIKPPRSLP